MQAPILSAELNSDLIIPFHHLSSENVPSEDSEYIKFQDKVSGVLADVNALASESNCIAKTAGMMHA